MEPNLMAVGDRVVSTVWGNKPFEISQEFGTYSADTAAMYPAEYTVPLGFPAGTHIGLDISMPRGTPLFALNPGKVIQSGLSPFFRTKPIWIETTDNPDTIKDESGYVEIYGHMWTNTVKLNDTVKAGDAIGTSGEQTKPIVNASGQVVSATMDPDGTGQHLHFELRKPEGGGYRAVNPRSWLTGTQHATDEDLPTNSTADKPTSDNPLDIGGIQNVITGFADQAVFILIGIVLLAIGIVAVKKTF
jgi:murein DD-endopeptidase MepM/ murein hydrolase activator NlpD